MFKPSHELCIRVRGVGQAVNFCAKSLSLEQGWKFQGEGLPSGIHVGSANVQWPRWLQRAAVQVWDPSHRTEGFSTL